MSVEEKIDAIQVHPGVVLEALSDETGVWRLLLDNPPVNAMSAELYKSLMATFDEVESTKSIRCLIVGSSTAGRFCGGADTRELSALSGSSLTPSDWEDRERLAMGVLERLGDLACPTVAAIDGYAVGMGFVVASLCDIRIGTTRSWFALPELDASRSGGPRHALRVLPQSVVRSMFFQGTRLGAERAFALGFLSELVEPEDLEQASITAAASIARYRPELLRMGKRSVNLGQDLSVNAGAALEQLYSYRMATSKSDEE